MKRILAIDGGGMRGVIPVAVLQYLEQRTQRPAADLFDGFAGTSIGGIVACLLAAGKRADEILPFFTEDGPRIFDSPKFYSFNGFFCPRYNGQVIEAALQKHLGSAVLAGCKKPLVITAYDISTGSPYLFETNGQGKCSRNALLWMIARATSAAQTYFPAFEFPDADGHTAVLWDGGNVANNPAMCGYAHAANVWPREDISVLSIGCGDMHSDPVKFDLRNAFAWGVGKVAAVMLSHALDIAPKLVDYEMNSLMGDNEQYFRIQTVLKKDLPLNDASPAALKALAAAGQECIEKNSATLDAFVRSITS